MGHLCSQGWIESYKMHLGVYPVHALWLMDVAPKYHLEQPNLSPCPSRMWKMPMAFLNSTSLHGFPYHLDGGQSSFRSSISCLLLRHSASFRSPPDCNPNFCFRSDYQGKKTFRWNRCVARVGHKSYREFDMQQVSFLLNDTWSVPRDVSNCSTSIHTRIR